MKYQRILRRLRQRAFDYPEEKAAKFDRVLSKVKARYMESAEKREEIEQQRQRESERMLRLYR